MSVKLLTEYYLEFLSLKGGCTGSYESTHVKMPHCRKPHALAYLKAASKESDDFIEWHTYLIAISARYCDTMRQYIHVIFTEWDISCYTT